MVRVVAVVWQSYYNMLHKASKNIKLFPVSVYSSRVLEQDPTYLKRVLKELDEADIIFCYRSSEAFWEEIEKKIKERKKASRILYLGHDPSYWTLSNVDPEVMTKAYTYLVMNGEKNLTNMLLFLVSSLFELNVSYEEPEYVPYEGLYHPRSPVIFTNVQEYLEWYRPKIGPTVGIIFSRYYWVNKNTEVEDLLITELEKRGFNVISGFAYSIKDESLKTKATGDLILEWFIDGNGQSRIDLFVKLISFFLGASREKKRESTEITSYGVEILKKLNVPVLSPLGSYYMTREEWEERELGMDVAWSVALPEFEGVIEPILISTQKDEKEFERRKAPVEERIKKLVDRISRWIELRRTPVKQRRMVFVLHNNPCASVEATVGSAAHLDSLESVAKILKSLKEAGYEVKPPESGKALIDLIMSKKAISEFRWTTVEEIVEKGGALAFVEKSKYLEWFYELPEKTRTRIIESWGEPPGEYRNGIPPAMLYNGKIVITGVSFGNALVMVQPKRGCAGSRCDGQVCRILHDPDTPPPHHYLATYRWISREYRAHVVIHVGTHGNLEFLPGKGVGLSESCLPDIAIDTVPHLYIYNADNPPEGTIAKRRSYAVLIDHMQTVLKEGGLYSELSELDRLLLEYQEAQNKEPARIHVLEHMIIDTLFRANLHKEIMVNFDGKRVFLDKLSHEDLHRINFSEIISEIHGKLSLIRNTQIQDGMHIFGCLPEGERKVNLIYSIMRYDAGSRVSLRREVAKILGYDLSDLISNPEKVDKKSGKSYGAILEDIDRLGKEIIREVLMEG